MADKKKSFKLKMSQNLAQLLIVMAGVFLGMLLTEWNTSRKTSARVEAAIEQIRIEISANQKMIERSIAHKRPFFDSLDSLEKSVSEELGKEPVYDRPFLERFPGWKGIGGIRADNSMYETAKFSDVIPEMNIELVQVIAKVYNTQNDYNRLRQTLMNRFLEMNSSSTYKDAFRIMWQIGEELGAYELKLQEEYKIALDKLEDYND
ncbi:MAG: hypothetical protein RLO81_14800 [Fulvivirga sp.]|uniref:hypothetical protein n=1 Tax=Fulvivirga sp. TaxID=1931237 RepID=UPI0032EDA326